MRDFRGFVGRSVVVSLSDDSTFAGTLDRVLKGSLVLTGARVLSAGRADIPVDGSVVLPAGSVVWVQVP